MSKQYLKEEFDILEELLRRAYDLIHPEEDFSHLYKKDMKERLYGKYPKCFLKILPIGRDTEAYLLPICNRAGIEDPKVIDISLKVTKRLIDNNVGKFDINALQGVLNSLQHRHNVLSKTVPKPATTAAKKAQVTRALSRIQGTLDYNKTDGMDV